MPGQPIDPDDEIADVNHLFGGTPTGKSGSTSGPVVPSGDSYDLGDEDPEEPAPWSRAPIAAPRRPAKPSPDAPNRPRPDAPKPPRVSESPRRERESEATVDEVWTRWGEWGPTVIQLAAGLGLVLILTYFFFNWFGLGAAFLSFVVGVAGLILLSYPIAVTLERPVRMTPEQALRDFYGSAAHHFPHYRRMWLLLSDEGRISSEFDSFATFRSYWKHRMTKLRGASVKSTTPLAFSVTEFTGDKSAGQTAIDASYKLTVRPRGEDGTVLDEVEIETSFVRGPDKMWYLNRGTM